jgi:hypothetical protein
MDIVAHALWANLAAELMTRRKRQAMRRQDRAWAMLGSVAPDFVAFFPYLVVSIFGSGGLLVNFLYRFGQEWHFILPGAESVTPPGWVLDIYSYSHSAFLWAVVVLLIYFMFRSFPFWLMGWGTHIALDVFTHEAGRFPTKLLYPFSDFYINATSWGNPVVFVGIYVALLLCYLAVYTRRTHNL